METSDHLFPTLKCSHLLSQSRLNGACKVLLSKQPRWVPTTTTRKAGGNTSSQAREAQSEERNGGGERHAAGPRRLPVRTRPKGGGIAGPVCRRIAATKGSQPRK